MNVKTKTYVEITLSEEEAKYLRGITQNHIGDWEEPDEDHKLRGAIFNALSEGLQTKAFKDNDIPF